ncbi:3-methyl-2-oxobutanoate dehydrogenase, partial [Emiliania huxleyi CCMP1516]|uniref:Lipoamide acyltransferase component of branched-chain alpha-keto acid dehydrogenase complex, mitochondrial n=2 Tax=Emiliania huxleyi TaxID=2903 RepID=A0A0D3J6I3_EMIH1
MLRRLAARSAPLARASAVRAARPPHALRLAAAPLSRSFVSTAAAAAPSSAQPFMLADIGEGIAEVEVLQWFVKPGDTVDQFDRICEVQSDKATVEISSPYVGTIESLEYEVGSIAKVGTPLLHISVLSTPATRALAKRHKLDLGTVTPTGRGGRVTKQDVLLVLNGSAP